VADTRRVNLGHAETIDTLDATIAAPTSNTADEVARTLQMSPDALADFAQTIIKNPNSTIEPHQKKSADALGRQALAGLNEQEQATGGIAAGLAMGATIGEGGMGIVRAATQRSLGRKVAVKTLRPDVKTENATLRLLREAWVTGSLEHPNIVPVYDLGLGDDGTPIIILKHIEGLAWCDLMRNVEEMTSRFGTSGDLLEHNLRILVQLCNAVSLAHARGVLHRDLKPENVMVGRFGEVYLVDWGIAVSLKHDPTGRMPLASEAKEMAGTPTYMAPEMLGAMGTLEERTDVYLLGSILHEILTGKPPHTGESFRQIVASILLSKFNFPEDVPTELAEIAAKAMSRAAEDRFASADELRLKLEWYLRHRGSLALSQEAQLRVDEMAIVLAAGGDAEEVRDRINHLFAEARFGFRQAIKACADNDAALAGLSRATEMVVEFELEAGTPEAAASALAELENPPPELAKRVAAAMRERELEKKKVAELKKLQAQHDPSTGRRTRLSAAMMLGTMWCVFPQFASWLYQREGGFPYWAMYLTSTGIFGLCALVGLWGRESLSKTVVNRRMLACVFLMFAGQLTLQLGGHLLHMDYPTLWVMHLFSWFMSLCAFSVLVDTRFWPSILAFLAGFVFSSIRPSQIFNVMTFVNLALLVNLAVAWSRPMEDRGYFQMRVRERIEKKRAFFRGGVSSRPKSETPK
jgi:eukaryotic-like serine/threonine-protein kinase